MRVQTTLVALAATAAAFPGMASVKKDILEGIRTETVKREAKPEPVSIPLPTIIGSLESTIEGLLGSVASSVNPSDKRPQPGYTFQAPSSTDARGPCPGLNLLANYGYLPRDGNVTFGQVLNATAEGFNMGADLAAVLAVFAILTDGDIATESWYIGTNPSTELGGLNRHSTVEADVSPNREDYYTGCGDNHHLSSRLFTQNVAFAALDSSKSFSLSTMTKQYDAIATFSKTYNPYLYYFPFPLIVSLGAFLFYPNFFSNGTYGAGGVPNYESISSIIGAKFDSSKLAFEYVPEQWPENWYRRSTEYDAAAVLVEMIPLYLTNPIVPGASTLLTPNFNITTLACDIYQGIQSITPLFITGSEAEAAAAATWAISKLDPYFSFTTLGCPTTTTSNVYPNPSNEGGPLNPPPSVSSNTGNNVYNKIYFETAPTTPKCSHSYSP